jgi:hypothetical protein
MSEITIKNLIKIILIAIIGITMFFITLSFVTITAEISRGITRSVVHKIDLFFNIK